MLQTSRYLAVMTEAIVAHGGTVDKFVGDAIMAIWNAPTEDPDHVAHACAAVLACRDANRELNEAFDGRGGPPTGPGSGSIRARPSSESSGRPIG